MIENTQFVKDCQATPLDGIVKRETLTFDELFNLKYPAEVEQDPTAMFLWGRFEIHARTKKDFEMHVWNGTHPVEKNTTEHICKAGTKVRVWMVSRMGDLGITDNLKDPHGYDCRGVEAEDLYDWEFVRTSNGQSLK
ncbi:MAG: hypothetical protein WC333_02295 [Dehalococcoidia bacterium]|jgi:hypothetical protein